MGMAGAPPSSPVVIDNCERLPLLSCFTHTVTDRAVSLVKSCFTHTHYTHTHTHTHTHNQTSQVETNLRWVSLQSAVTVFLSTFLWLMLLVSPTLFWLTLLLSATLLRLTALVSATLQQAPWHLWGQRETGRHHHHCLHLHPLLWNTAWKQQVGTKPVSITTLNRHRKVFQRAVAAKELIHMEM